MYGALDKFSLCIVPVVYILMDGALQVRQLLFFGVGWCTKGEVTGLVTLGESHVLFSARPCLRHYRSCLHQKNQLELFLSAMFA